MRKTNNKTSYKQLLAAFLAICDFNKTLIPFWRFKEAAKRQQLLFNRFRDLDDIEIENCWRELRLYIQKIPLEFPIIDEIKRQEDAKAIAEAEKALKANGELAGAELERAQKHIAAIEADPSFDEVMEDLEAPENTH